jgi:putative hydrolase of HD superfamily
MTPEQLVQRQFDAYNAKDLDGWAATYAPDAEQLELHGARLAKGRDEIRARMVERFKEPDLHAELLGRFAMGNVVVDHERVTRSFPEGRGTMEMLCIYEVSDGFIRRASFGFGAKKIG